MRKELGEIEQTGRYVFFGETAFLFDIKDTEMSIRILALNASCMRLKECGMVVAITGINLRQIPEKCLQNRVASSSQALKEVQHSTSCLQQPVSIQNALRNNPRAREGRGQEQKQEAGAGCGEKARGRRRAAAAHCGAACHMSHVTCHIIIIIHSFSWFTVCCVA